jgi:hypothetical protein
MFNIFALKEMQMKTTMRFHLTPVRMARKQVTAHEYVGEKELIYYCWWDCKLGEPLWKSVRRVIKTKLDLLPFHVLFSGSGNTGS